MDTFKPLLGYQSARVRTFLCIVRRENEYYFAVVEVKIRSDTISVTDVIIVVEKSGAENSATLLKKEGIRNVCVEHKHAENVEVPGSSPGAPIQL